MLVQNSTYDNKKRSAPSNQQTYKFIADGTLYRFNDQHGRNLAVLTDGSVRVVVSLLELARTIFLENIHLTRTALRPNGLAGMALADESGDVSTIRFNRMSDYPLTNLRSNKAKHHLVWLLFDKDARRSFGSIYQSLLDSETSEWHFDFIPPNLKGWNIAMLGAFSESDPALFHADEIIGLHNPYFEYLKPVDIYHPSHREAISIDPVGGKRPEINRPDPDPQLNIPQIPKIGRKLDLVNEMGFSFTFGSGMNVRVQPGKELKRVSPIVKEDSNVVPSEAGVGHATEDGAAQELDYGLNRDDSDHEIKLAETTERFNLFKMVIADLVSQVGYQHISTTCYELPKPRNGKGAYINKKTGKPRVFHVAQFYYSGWPLMVIEVDIEDLRPKHTLSTRVFGFHGDSEAGFNAVMQSCADAGVHWNADVIDEHCSVFGVVKHPNKTTKVEEGKDDKRLRTDKEYHDAWVAVLHNVVSSSIKALTERGGHLNGHR